MKPSEIITADSERRNADSKHELEFVNQLINQQIANEALLGQYL